MTPSSRRVALGALIDLACLEMLLAVPRLLLALAGALDRRGRGGRA